MNADFNRLKSKKLFLFDIDGTLAVGDSLYEGSARLLSYIDAIGGRAYYITNNSTRSGRDYVEKFRRAFHLETTEDQFITSGYMTLRFLQEHYPEGKIFVLGTASFIAELKKNGLHVTETAQEDIDCVVAAYDSELTYEKLVQACKALSTTNAPFYGTNPDLCCPIDFGFVPDCGGICRMLEAATDRAPYYVGKPDRRLVELCMEQVNASGDQVIVVGDRLYTDIACGIHAGVETALVYTGEAKPEDIEYTEYKPDYTYSDIQQLYEAFVRSREADF